jgi:feruloyl-CoA synthase
LENLITQPPLVSVSRVGPVIYLAHPNRLGTHDDNLVAMLTRVTGLYESRPFLIERSNGQWSTVTYGEFRDLVASTATRLANCGVGSDDIVVLLMRNSTAHAAIAFAVMALGGAVVPLSTLHFGSESGRAAIFRQMAQVETSWTVLDDDLFEAGAVDVCAMPAREVLGDLDGDKIDLANAARRTAASSVAKLLFTSGSTGSPKVVVNTHGMLAASAAMVDACSPRLPEDAPPVIADWLPWHHTFGGNINFHTTMLRGGVYWIDRGLPAPGLFEETLETLQAAGPTVFTSVPSAYPMLLNALEADPERATRILRNIRTASCGGAALAPSVADRFQRLCQRATGSPVRFGAGYGMTETGGILTMAWWPSERLDLLGLPLPGVDLKLVPLEGDDGYELRAKGPNVFDGYREEGPKAFDDEGYFLTGDAVRAADPGNWLSGLTYSGRLSEDFKLANGTWVRAGPMRDRLLAMAANVREIMLIGSGSREVGAIIWADGSSAEIEVAIREFNAGRSSASTRIGWVGRSSTPPNPAMGELTTKGSLNIRRLLETRRDEIAALAADPLVRF